jgi:biotin synthase
MRIILMINELILEAYKILDGKVIDKELAVKLSGLEGEDILDLISLANKVNKKFNKSSHVCTIMNAKSGICSEDCKFCAQSSHYKTGVEKYPLMNVDEMVGKAKEAYSTGVRHFGIVTSGKAYKKLNDEFKKILNTIDEIYNLFPDMTVCAGLGNLSEETAKALADHKIDHYSINIQTNPSKYAQLISTTHSIEDKVETIKLLQKYGVKTCTGGILGLGETMEDRIEMAFALKELDVDTIPLNVLLPIKGTPVEDNTPVSVAEITKTFALFRLINPSKVIKFAAGRETRMRDFQGLLMLAGANGFLTGGYLTTRGREVEDDLRFRKELEGFNSVFNQD